jgi:hypothetical protein
LTESAYLDRLALRGRNKAVQRCAAVGVIAGTLLFVTGLYFYYLVPNVNDRAWRAAIEAGGVILLLTLLAPTALTPLETTIRRMGHLVFHALLLGVLALLFFAFVVPAGAFMRRRVSASGWEDKIVRTTAARAGGGRRSLLVLPFFVVSYFIQERHYVLLPVVLLMIIAGLALLFLQTSALAPFIYTLF